MDCTASTMNPDPLLQPRPLDDYVALGAIRLFRGSDRGAWHMTGPNDHVHPHKDIVFGEDRGWIKTVFLNHTSNPDHAALRILALPEDVNRSSRGSTQHLRKVLKLLADFIDTCPATWNANYDLQLPVQTYKKSDFLQEQSLFYIFNTLSSPCTTLGDAGSLPQNQESMNDVLQDSIAGLRTSLYPYQRRSICAMLQKEVHPSKSRDPRKPRFTDLNGSPFYFDVHEGNLFRHPHLYSDSRGGILAETMGYGKTLICIALILATRGHYPAMPEGRVNAISNGLNQRTPSLLELAAKKIKQNGVPWKSHFASLKKEGYHFDTCIEALESYDGEYSEPLFHPTTPDRKNKKRQDFRVLRLSYATLLIVPPNLLVQWQDELAKHTDSGALDVLVLDSTVKDIPHWKEMMKYDIVLITKARFEQEYRDDHLNQARRFGRQEKYHSQLTEIRWLRVICDEGHGFVGSSYKTNAMAMLNKMSVERRWVVSGTPSQSLHGVEFNLAINETHDAKQTSRNDSIKSALEQRKDKDATNDEVKDMERLRAIIVNFLKVQPWANQKGADYCDWKKYLHPFDASDKCRFAPALRPILQSLIIRHRIEDIDSDLSLPVLRNTTVYLEPSYYDKLSMNLFRMVLTSNAITSERVDSDYMFQSRNRKYLDELITNLRRSSFHWVGFSKDEVAETLRVSKKYLHEKLDVVSDQDGALLTEAIMNGERALSDSGWEAFSFYHEIGVYVENFPRDSATAWALNGEHSTPLLLGTKQAREAQQHVLKHLDDVDPGAGLPGAGMRAMFAATERGEEEQAAREKSRPTANGKSPTTGTVEEPKVKRQSATSSSPIRAKNEGRCHQHKRRLSSMEATLPPSLAAAQIVGFSSAKLNYLCSRILELQSAEKIIIFYDSNNIAFWIAEALELLSVKFLIYANTLSVTRRADYLATFNQSSVFRVLLMDLKQASHGLHIAAATRIFIVSPIWQPDVESQAIKRAHRIGQTRPVFVETLVLQGTLEEKILKRRRQMSNAELVKAEKSLLDDDTMNGIIRLEGFLKIDDAEKVEMKGGKLARPVSLFERRDGPFSSSGNDDGDLILGSHGRNASKRRKKMPEKSPTAKGGNGKEESTKKAVAFANAAEFLPPPTNPADASHSSIFGDGLPSVVAKPKKSVGFSLIIPRASDAGSSSGGGASGGGGGSDGADV